MRFPPGILDEIRARLPVSAVVGRRVKLIKAGREWKGLSPFNAERTPSFFVNDQKGQFFDFSSGKNGDIFRFVMETEGLSFPEAVERLAAEAGVALPRVSAEAVAAEEERKSLHEVIALAARFFEDELMGARGVAARRYLEGRGLMGPERSAFGLGYAPNERFALRDHLAGKGVPAEAMIAAGLLIHGDDIPVPYDRFRDRVMFPIHDPRGRVIAFGGRALAPDTPAKYLNSPETALFHKSEVLFNHHRARKAAHAAGSVIAVEGYVDVIALHRAGIIHAVAPLGTALTETQLELLWRMAPEPILAFDGDRAGRRAAERAIDVALPRLAAGRSLRFAFLPEGLDPDDLLRQQGPAALQAALARTEPLAAVLWRREAEREPLDTPERRAGLERRLREAIAAIPDETLRKHYRADVDARLAPLLGGRGAGGPARGHRAGAPRGRFRGRPDEPPLGEGERLRQAAGEGAGARLLATGVFAGGEARGALPPREAALVLGAVRHPLVCERFGERFAVLALRHRELDRLRRALIDLHAEGAADAESRLAAMGFGWLLDEAARAMAGMPWLQRSAPAEDVVRGWCDAADLQESLGSLHSDLEEAASGFSLSGSPEDAERLAAVRQRWLARLAEAHRPVEGRVAGVSGDRDEERGEADGRAAPPAGRADGASPEGGVRGRP